MTRVSAALTWIIGAGLLLNAGLPVALGQTPEAAPAEEAADAPPAEALTVPDAVTLALTAIEKAEAGGPEATVAAQKAYQLAQYVLAKDPTNAHGTFVLGRVLLLQGRYREAMGYLREYTSTRVGSNDWLGFKLLADILTQGSYYELAQAKYEEALKLNKVEPSIHLGLARVKLAQKMLEDAAQHARQAIELDEEPSLAAQAILAQTLLQMKNYEEADVSSQRAVELARAAIREAPFDRPKLMKLNEMLGLRLGILQTRQAVMPEQANTYIAMAHVIQDQADLGRLMAWHQAVAILEQGVTNTAPNTPPELLLETARLQYAVGRKEDACIAVDSLLDTHPDHPEAKQLREQIGCPTVPASP